jgi:predicted membrane channel-forming protein YqfA (hemolysin III family)
MVRFRYIIVNTLHTGNNKDYSNDDDDYDDDNNNNNNKCPFRHYSVPHVPEIKGIEEFKGLVQHSKVYRSAESYRNLRVVVLGAASSGMDIAVEVSTAAEKVRPSYGYISVVYLLSLNFCENVHIIYRMVCHIEGGTETEGVREQDGEEHTWN